MAIFLEDLEVWPIDYAIHLTKVTIPYELVIKLAGLYIWRLKFIEDIGKG